MRYCLTQVRISTIKKTKNNAGKAAEKGDFSCAIAVAVNLYNYYGKQYGNSSRN